MFQNNYIVIVLAILELTFGQVIFVKYENIKNDIGVVAYSTEQRLQVAESVKTMLSIYVNKESKIYNYKTEYPNIDPVPEIEKIISESASLSDIDFHYRFLDIFNALRDFQTSYQLPGPHGCVEIFKEVYFDMAGTNASQKVKVAGYSHNQIIELLPGASRVHIGDELISISGISVRELIEKSAFKTGGANHAGSLRATLKSFSMLSGKFSKLPHANSDVYKFKRNSRVFDVELPWISTVDNECWMQSQKILLTGQDPNSKASVLVGTGTATHNSNGDQSIETNSVERDGGVEPQRKKTRLSPMKVSDQKVQWTIYHRKLKTIGIIAVKPYEPTATEVHKVFNQIRDLLLYELKDTEAIIFDVRSNSDGTVLLADLIPQLFGGNVKTGSLRTVANNIMKEFLAIQGNENWIKSIERVRVGDYYTPLVKFSTNKKANRIGQVYVKPVGVFTNGGCLFACEIFAANMRDNYIASIFGEDSTTGGGGSDSIDYSTSLSTSLPHHFKAIPYTDQMTSGVLKLTVAVSQFVRITGRLIEDTGIASDYIIRPEARDFTSLTISTQFDRIADVLIKEGQISGKKRLSFQFFPYKLNFACQIGSHLRIYWVTMGYKTVEILDESNTTLHTSNDLSLTGPFQNSYGINTEIKSLSLERYNIRGRNYIDKIKYSSWISVRYTPRYSSYLQIIPPKNIRLMAHSNYVGIYDVGGTGSNWVADGSTLIISTMGQEVESIISFFVALKNSQKFLIIKGFYRINNRSDFLKIGYIKDGMSVDFLDVDTTAPLVNDVSPLNRAFVMPAGYIEIFIHFKSDGNSAGSGVTIKSIDII